MSITNDVPTEEQLQSAIVKAKADGYSSTDITTTDSGASMVRHNLPSHFDTWSLDRIRRECINLSRKGREPGTKKRPRSSSVECTLARLVKLRKISETHSELYDRIHLSEEYRTLRDRRKQALEYMCQLCCRTRLGRDPGRMLILCKECHAIADIIRERGLSMDGDGDNESLSLFDM